MSFHPSSLSYRTEWNCSLCLDLSEPSDPYSSKRPKSPQGPCLSLLDQRVRVCTHQSNIPISYWSCTKYFIYWVFWYQLQTLCFKVLFCFRGVKVCCCTWRWKAAVGSLRSVHPQWHCGPCVWWLPILCSYIWGHCSPLKRLEPKTLWSITFHLTLLSKAPLRISASTMRVESQNNKNQVQFASSKPN